MRRFFLTITDSGNEVPISPCDTAVSAAGRSGRYCRTNCLPMAAIMFARPIPVQPCQFRICANEQDGQAGSLV